MIGDAEPAASAPPPGGDRRRTVRPAKLRPVDKWSPGRTERARSREPGRRGRASPRPCMHGSSRRGGRRADTSRRGDGPLAHVPRAAPRGSSRARILPTQPAPFGRARERHTYLPKAAGRGGAGRHTHHGRAGGPRNLYSIPTDTEQGRCRRAWSRRQGPSPPGMDTGRAGGRLIPRPRASRRPARRSRCPRLPGSPSPRGGRPRRDSARASARPAPRPWRVSPRRRPTRAGRDPPR